MATPAEAQFSARSPTLGARERVARFCRRFGLQVPILLQAPMAGACPASVASAVANAGGMGGRRPGPEDRNDAAHRRAQILSRAHRLPTRPADGRQDGRSYRAALGSSSLRADETLGARHLSWA